LRRTIFIPLIVLALLLAGCKSTYYKTMRTLGKEKRDILVQRIRAMRRTEDQIAPVLKAFHDQVLFLKHNLNSRAIGSLKGTSATLQGDVADLVQSIDASSQEADKLISSLAASDNKN
jgi:predicted small secreted protein